MALACEKSFPFDSEIVNGEYDRTYLADDFAQYFRELIYSGVFMKESTNLQVLANGDMTLTMKAGERLLTDTATRTKTILQFLFQQRMRFWIELIVFLLPGIKMPGKFTMSTLKVHLQLIRYQQKSEEMLSIRITLWQILPWQQAQYLLSRQKSRISA